MEHEATEKVRRGEDRRGPERGGLGVWEGCFRKGLLWV